MSDSEEYLSESEDDVIQPIPRTKKNLLSREIEFNIKVSFKNEKFKKLTSKIGLQFFKSVCIDSLKIVPYAIYIQTEQNYYKMTETLTGDFIKDKNNYMDSLLFRNQDKMEKEHIYFLFNINPILSESPIKKSYSRVDINLKNSTMRVTVTSNYELFENRFLDTFQNIKLVNMKTITTNATFKYLSYLNLNILADAIFSVKEVSESFFIQESDKSYAYKRGSDIFYINKHVSQKDKSNKLNIKNKKFYSDITLDVIYVDNDDYSTILARKNFKKNEMYSEINIHINGDYDADIYINQLVYDLNNYFETVKKGIEDNYYYFVHSFKGYIEREKNKESKFKKGDDIESYTNPYIFQKNCFSTKCTSKRKPSIIDEEDIIYRKGKTYLHEKRKTQYGKERIEVIKFPPDFVLESRPDIREYFENFPEEYRHIFLACKNPDFPYLGMRESICKITGETYFIPCCYKLEKDSINVMYDVNKKKTTIKEQTNIIKGKTLLTEGKIGRIEETFYILENYIKDNGYKKELKLHRLGTKRYSKSFVKSIHTALNEQEKEIISYKGTNFEDKLEKKGFNEFEIRKKVIEKDFQMSLKDILILISQEMYDSTEENIVNTLYENEILFDSSKFYRIFEHFFNVNIYVITPDKRDNIDIEIPRNYNGHYRLKNKKKCILIYKYSVGSKFPQYEPLFHKKGKVSTFIFDKTMNNTMHKLLTKKQTLNSDIFKGNIIQKDYLRLLEDVLIDNKILYQVIDKYGKGRAFIIKFKKDKNEYVIISKEPFQPYPNISLLKDIYFEKNILPEEYIIEKIKETNNNFFEFKNFYIRKSFESNMFDPLITDLFIFDQTYSNSYSNIQETLNIILQLIHSLYILSKLKPMEFVNKYINIDNTSELYINMENENIPSKSFNKLFRFCENNIEGMIKDGKVIIKNKKIKKNITYFLKSSYLYTNKTNYIKGFYKKEEDLMSCGNNYSVLFGEENFNNWIETMSISSLEQNLIKYTPYKNSTTEPYFLDIKNTIYLVQNVIYESFDSSLYVSLIFNTKGYNIGYNDNSFSIDKIKKVSYTILNIEGNVVKNKERKERKEKINYILEYILSGEEEKKYASLMIV